MATIHLLLFGALATGVAANSDAARAQIPQQAQKDECMLNGQNCPVMTIQEKIEKLRGEIRKGDAVYQPKELEKLEDKLKEAEGLYEELITR